MKQKFFEINNQSNFIKNLLKNTGIPLTNSVREGDYIVNGFVYLFKSYLLRCTKSGYLGSTATYELVTRHYKFGRNYIGNTEIFESNNLSYDSDTHKMLGDYLRFYRDVFECDLMPFYNCFNGVYTTKFYIALDNNELVVKQTNYDFYSQGTTEFNNRYKRKEDFKVALVPIKFNKDYMLCVDCNSTVNVSPCFINNGQLMQVNIGGEKLNLTYDYNRLNNGITTYNHMFFNQPEVINISNKNTTKFENIYSGSHPQRFSGIDEVFQTYEDYLYLMIQLPNTNDSSIAVIEGNYSEKDIDKIINVECFNPLITGKYAIRIDEGNCTLDSNLFEKNYPGIINSSSDVFHFYLDEKETNYDIWKDDLGNTFKDIKVIQGGIVTQTYLATMDDELNIGINLVNNYIYSVDTQISVYKPVDAISNEPTDSELDKILISKNLSIASMNDRYRYPYADRLIEYLLWNVIDNNDDIGNNIIKVQDYLNVDYSQHLKGAFDKYVRTNVFYTYKNNYRYNNTDSNGYVDKDVEKNFFN